jgi:iron complex transport system substrate-binding protein
VPWLAAQTYCAQDDLGIEVCLTHPAQRIAALSPGATELLFAAGAGKAVVAVVEHSDYPPEAARLPLVGGLNRIDLERLLALRPDLVIAWVTGNPAGQVATLNDLGLNVFSIEPRTFEAVADTLERLATLAGTQAAGFAQAQAFREGMIALQEQFSRADPVSVFYQVWDEPLMTVNDTHLISEMIRLCGGRNRFGELDRLVPQISIEAVLAANPEAILAGGMGEADGQWLASWKSYPHLLATQRDNLFFIPPSLVQRPTPRILQGTRLLCDKLEQARARRP